MHISRRRKQLTANATARLTQEEERLVRERAEASGLSKSEWCRQTLLQALDTAPATRMLLAELTALRVLTLTLQTDLMKGVRLTDERVAEMVAKSEREKFAMADKRIHAYRSLELRLATTSHPEDEV